MEGASRNYMGLLNKERQVVSKSAFDASFLEQEVQNLKNHVIIMSFVDNMPTLYRGWLRELQWLVAP